MKLLYVILTFFISVTAFSQNEDYLVKTNGDTVRGDITLKNKIFYVRNETVSEIDAYEVYKIKSNKYKGTLVLNCKLYNYTDDLSELEIDYIKRSSIDTVMILKEIYATPKINLYYATNTYKTPFYFYKTPSDPNAIQLVVRYYLEGGLNNYDNDRARYRGNKSMVQIAEDKGYVNQMFAIMGDCYEIPESMWELLSYRDYSFIQLIKKYNKCD